MIVCILDYTDGNVIFQDVPDDVDTEEYLFIELDYNMDQVYWMEVKSITGIDELINQIL